MYVGKKKLNIFILQPHQISLTVNINIRILLPFYVPRVCVWMPGDQNVEFTFELSILNTYIYTTYFFKIKLRIK